jgi:hypothetical protein
MRPKFDSWRDHPNLECPSGNLCLDDRFPKHNFSKYFGENPRNRTWDIGPYKYQEKDFETFESGNVSSNSGDVLNFWE